MAHLLHLRDQPRLGGAGLRHHALPSEFIFREDHDDAGDLGLPWPPASVLQFVIVGPRHWPLGRAVAMAKAGYGEIAGAACDPGGNDLLQLSSSPLCDASRRSKTKWPQRR